jgi:teichuronic acid exporter
MREYVVSVKEATIWGFIWRFLQNSTGQLVSFVVSIILARILMPDDYGLIAMIMVFISIAMVFINTGFSSALIQRKDLKPEEIDTVFYSGVITSVVLYWILFYTAPWIATFYGEERLVLLLRVESIIVIIGALYSVQQALIIREMKFWKSFIVNITGAVVYGVVGITYALRGYGPWALVYGAIANYLTCAVIMWIVVKWVPRLRFSIKAFRSMFLFSAKILASNLLDALFNNLRSLIIGKQYSSVDLAYYSKGYQFPTLIMTQVDGAITTVLFSALSKYQDDWETGLRVLRRAMKTSMYVCAPLMAGLYAISEPMILLLLTDKWAGSIEYVRLTTIICVMWPLSARRHALNALGKSGISLILNIIGKALVLIFILSPFKTCTSLNPFLGNAIERLISSSFARRSEALTNHPPNGVGFSFIRWLASGKAILVSHSTFMRRLLRMAERHTLLLDTFFLL